MRKRREPRSNKPRKEKARVNGGKELTQEKNYASGRLYVLEIDLNLGGRSDEPTIHALKLLSAELKRQIHP